MKIATRPNSIKEACVLVKQGRQTFAVAMGGFIDNFQSNWNNPEKQYSMIVEEPALFSDDENVLNRKVSAIAAQLAVDFGVREPEWTVLPRWTVGKEYFDLFDDAPVETKLLVKENVLPEFAKRNIFEGDAIMLRDGVRKTITWYQERHK